MKTFILWAGSLSLIVAQASYASGQFNEVRYLLNGQERSAVVETFASGKSSFDVFYVELAPIAIEKRDRATGKLTAFKHKGMFQGETYWTDWLPGEFREKLHVSWPSARAQLVAKRGASETVISELQSPETILELNDAIGANADEPWIPFSKRVNWSKPGEYSWSINQQLHPLWAGFLWEFSLGQMWKGYRKGGKKDKMLTPSQEQADYKRADVEKYYREHPVNPLIYNPSNSRNLSPLDKFGIWATRAHPESRYASDWKQASMWEGINKHDSFEWGGYCNGSVAASILYSRPNRSFVDRGITWDPRDIVAILQSSSWVVDFIQMGYRCMTGLCDKNKPGSPGGPETRIEEPAAEFAVDMVDYYVGTRGIPLASDLEADPEVGNEVIYSAKLKIKGTGPTERYGELYVESVTNFDDKMLDKDEVGFHPDLDKKNFTKNTYGFKIYLNRDGSLARTEWDKADYHPDFFWLPTDIREAEAYWPNGIQPPDGTSWQKNPYLRIDWVKELHELSL